MKFECKISSRCKKSNYYAKNDEGYMYGVIIEN